MLRCAVRGVARGVSVAQRRPVAAPAGVAASAAVRAMRPRTAATTAAARLQNVYHDENPMAAEWRRRDLMRSLRDTHDADSIAELCRGILDAEPGAEPLHPKDATLLISKFGKAGDVEGAEAVYARDRAPGTTPAEELRVKSALMHVYIRAGRFEQARDVFNELDGNVAFRLDGVVVAAAATVAAALGDADLLTRAGKALRADPDAVPLAPTTYEVARAQMAGKSGGPEAAEAVADEVVSAYRALGQKLRPADACTLFQAVVDACAAAGDHEGVLRVTERMVDASQRPTEAAVVQSIDAAGALGSNNKANDRLMYIFARFRAGPRINAAVYERLMGVLAGQGNHLGVCTVYDEVSSHRRPTPEMADLLQTALRNLPRSKALDYAQRFGVATESL